MIKFYFSPAPNPAKVALFLEEAGLPYETIPVDTRKGEQHEPAFVKLNPNAKLPVIVDGDAVVFDSNAILLYLAEKTGQFLPANTPQNRAQMYSWLMFIASGIGPYSGQLVHFKHHAPEKLEYAVNRYDFEAHRHWSIIEEKLGQSPFMLGDTYTIVDMALWGWTRAVPFILGEGSLEKMPNLKRHFDTISARPAALRVDELKNRFTFKSEMDDESRRAMFRHLTHKAS